MVSNRSNTCGCSSMVELQPSKLTTRVRFPSPAPCNHGLPLRGPFFFGDIPGNRTREGGSARWALPGGAPERRGAVERCREATRRFPSPAPCNHGLPLRGPFVFPFGTLPRTTCPKHAACNPFGQLWARTCPKQAARNPFRTTRDKNLSEAGGVQPLSDNSGQEPVRSRQRATRFGPIVESLRF